MAISGKSGMIDGFTSVQAVRRKNERSSDVNTPQKKAPLPQVKESTPNSAVQQKKKVSIGHTALPSRHDLVCYSCQYKFTVTGSLNKLFCPKCREQLETGDHTIEGKWTNDILTVGKVHIKPGAKVIGASIVANDIIVGGDCSEANLKPVRHIELESGAVVSPGVLNSHKVIIRTGAKIALDVPLRCSDLDIYGEIQAKAIPTGTVTIFAGGMLRGKLNASHLIVYDGGGLSADLNISPVVDKPKSEQKNRPNDPEENKKAEPVLKKADKDASQLSFEKLK